jgi:hypothetical protein
VGGSTPPVSCLGGDGHKVNVPWGVAIPIEATSPYGEIGIHVALRMQWPRGRAGSIPVMDTVSQW